MAEHGAVADVVAILLELRELLAQYKITPWVEHIDRLLAVADHGPDSLKTAVLGMYGGMGSLNDLYICRANGFDVQDEKAVDTTLSQLVHKLWVNAKHL